MNLQDLEVGLILAEKQFCKKCGKEEQHSVYSKTVSRIDNEEKIAIKIYCLQCRRLSSLKDESRKLPVKHKETGPNLQLQWELEVKNQLGTLYNKDGIFKKNQIVIHPKFGTMKCISTRIGKVDFLCQDGMKVLISKNV